MFLVLYCYGGHLNERNQTMIAIVQLCAQHQNMQREKIMFLKFTGLVSFVKNDPMKSSCTEGTTLFYTEKSVLHRFLWYFWSGNKVHSFSQFIYRLFKVFFKINI